MFFLGMTTLSLKINLTHEKFFLNSKTDKVFKFFKYLKLLSGEAGILMRMEKVESIIIKW